MSDLPPAAARPIDYTRLSCADRLPYAVAAYAAASRLALAGEDLEAEALVRSGAKLRTCLDAWEEGAPGLEDALFRAERVWQVLASTMPAAGDGGPVLAQRVLVAFRLLADLRIDPDRAGLEALVALHRDAAGEARSRRPRRPTRPATPARLHRGLPSAIPA